MDPQPTAILLPSLWRPAGLDRVLHNIRDTTPEEHAIYVAVDKADEPSIEVCQTHEVEWFTDDAGWFCERIQFLFEQSTEPWFFTGSDDIVHTPGWLSGCFKAVTDAVKVVCPSDGHNPKGTNFLVNREYVLERGGNFDTPGNVYHPDYQHNYSDDELVNTAIHRSVYSRAYDVLVESTHPAWGNAPVDATYQRVGPSWEPDRNLYMNRMQLWGGRELWR